MKRNHVVLIAKVALSIGLIVLIANHVDLRQALAVIGNLRLDTVLLVLAIIGSQLPLLAVRWRAVVRCLDADLPFGDSLRFSLIGLFFNQALPTSFGGDAVRAWFLRRRGSSWMTALVSVFIDRFVALVVLVPMFAVGLPFLRPFLPDDSLYWSMLALVVLAAAGVVVTVLAGPSLARLFARIRSLSFLADVMLVMRRVFVSPRYAPVMLLSSLAGHVGTVLAVYLLAQGVGADLSFAHALMLVPLVMLVLALPLSFAGWGLREGAMVVLLGFVGVSVTDALAVSVCLGIALLVVAIPGGILWLMMRPAVRESGKLAQ